MPDDEKRARVEAGQPTDAIDRSVAARLITPSRLLIWFGALLIIGSIGAAALVSWQFRENMLARADEGLRRLALSQAEQTLAVLKGADLALLDMQDDLVNRPVKGEELHRTLQSIVATLPQLKSLFIADAEGRVLYGARSEPPPHLSVADTPYFKAHRDGAAGPLITPTYRARLDGHWALLLTRRLVDRTGRFAGIAAADIDPLYLSKLYADVDLGQHRAIALLTRDGHLLARHPWLDDRVGTAVDVDALAACLAQGPTGSMRKVSGLDHVDRLHGYATLDAYPLVVVTLLDASAVLDGWWRQVYATGAWVSGGDAIIALLIGLLVVQMRRRERSEARFQDFAEAASDWYWETDANLTFTYVSRTGRGQAEFPVHDALGRNLRDMVVIAPGDQSLVQLEATVAARQRIREFFCQVKASSGRVWHLNLSGTPCCDAKGAFAGYRGVARDITAIVEERSASARANMRFLYAMESGTDGFSFWDAEDRFVVCNALYRQRAGRAARFLVPGVTFEKYIWESLRLGDISWPAGQAAEILAQRMASHRAASGDPVILERCGRRLMMRDLRTPDGGTLIVLVEMVNAADGRTAA